MARKKPEPVTLTDVEIPDLFAGLEFRTGKRRTEDRAQRSVTFGGCPGCSANKVGLVRQGDHLAWRDHNYRTHGDLSLQCPAVGQRLCELPARDVWAMTGTQTPVCACTNR